MKGKGRGGKQARKKEIKQTSKQINLNEVTYLYSHLLALFRICLRFNY